MAEEKPAPSKKGGLVPMIAVGVVALALGAGGSYFVFGGSGEDAKGKKGEAEASEEAAEHGEEAADEGGEAEAGHGEEAAEGDAGGEAAGGGDHGAGGGNGKALSDRLLTLDPFVVNVDGEGFRRFLKARIELEARSASDRKAMLARAPQLRDAILVVLSSKRLEDLGGLEGKAILKNEIAERLDDLVGPGKVKAVLITEFVIQ